MYVLGFASFVCQLCDHVYCFQSRKYVRSLCVVLLDDCLKIIALVEDCMLEDGYRPGCMFGET